jgi:hypothetical protein
MTKPKELKVGDRVSDGQMIGLVASVDTMCRDGVNPGGSWKFASWAKVSWPDGQITYEHRAGLRKLPDRKEGA